MELTPEQEKAISVFNAASSALKKAPHPAKTELIYGAAYQTLVRLGLAPQLRKKYRGGK